MDARTLLTLFDAIFLLALAAWLGALLFFSFGVAPIIFQVLEAAQAARFVRTLFPRYYAWGATSATIALAAFTSGVLVYPEFRGPGALAQIVLLLGGVLGNLYCGNVLTPRINAARDAGPEQSSRFDRLHRRSVRINALMLLSSAVLVVAHACRPDPTGPGVSEPSPAERARRSVDRWRQEQQRWRSARTAAGSPAVAPLREPEPEGPRSGLEAPRIRVVN
ncbi:DUF4149 domain-containing protein [Tautonia sociabilis]|uniref:DUF4149 domain-containing protein n=1 Tax=Tautonia sociabilis TaxID=2080755 RepID=A0A432MHT2_9BACT|nr:DUF4149 domain-containing protein [Tautonia sociabilis]RUL86921.1 DUF4149 domain-containing protein [Tautonia sociabilis]